MKKIFMIACLSVALFTAGIRAEEVVIGDWVWTGAGWYYTGTNKGGDPIPPPPPPKD